MSLRKILLAIVLIIAIVLCYQTAVNGLTIGDFKIPSYMEIEQQNTELEQQISELNRKNTTDFETKKTALEKAIKDYNAAKENYQAVAPQLNNIKTSEIEVDLGIKPYDIEYLLVKIGNYATEKGITILFNVIKSGAGGSTTTTVTNPTSGASTTSKEYYTMADIDFTIAGEYNSLIEFMYAIEGDDELRFEINDFAMVGATGNNTVGGVQATFKVKGIPVNNSNLINLYEPVMSTNTVNNTTDGTALGLNTSNPLGIDKNNVGGMSQEVKDGMSGNN